MRESMHPGMRVTVLLVESSSLPFEGTLTTNPPDYEIEVVRGHTVPKVNFGYEEE